MEDAYSKYSFLNEQGMRDSVTGTNLGKSVSRPTLAPGNKFEMWVRNNSKPGMHAISPGTDPSTLGIEIANRHLETFEVKEPIQVTRSTVADFPKDRIADVGGKGGGDQYILPPKWQDSVRKVIP